MEENNGIIVAQDEPEIIDLLNRDKFIHRLVEITETLAAKKKGICYAINGEWGVGKTFALNLFKKEIADIQSETGSASKYLIFEYNAWEYDYYSEPLVAIVAAILDQIDDKVALISSENKKILIEIAKEIGGSILNKALSKLKEKSGLDIKKIIKMFTSSYKKAKKKSTDGHSYDPFFDFKDILTKLSKTIASLAEDQTVVFIVDELDRCLPEYTIKVLERLHHLFENVPNVQVILSVDKCQLESTVSQIYGNRAIVNRYLSKFIDFEITLDFGTSFNLIKECFAEYYHSFSFDRTGEVEVLSFSTTLFKGIDIRRRKAIIGKSFLCHQLVCPNTDKCDSLVLCLELFLSLLSDFGLNEWEAKKYADKEHYFTASFAEESKVFSSLSSIPAGLVLLENICCRLLPKSYYAGIRFVYGVKIEIRAFEEIYDLIWRSYRLILGFKDDWIEPYWGICASEELILKDYIKKYWEILHAIN